MRYIGKQLNDLPGKVTAVASGTLADGSAVIVNANGTVSVIVGQNGMGSDVVFETGATSAISAVFQANTNQVIIFYRDQGNSNYGTAIAGAVNASDNSIAFGTAHVFASHYIYYSGSTFDTNSNRAVVAYNNHASGSRSVRAMVGHISSGTNFTFGTATQLSSSGGSHSKAVFDSTNNRVVLFWQDGSTGYGKAVVGNITASNNSIALGSVVQFSAGNFLWQQGNTGTTFDTNAGKVVISYKDSNQSPNRGVVNVGTVTASNNSISFGSPVVIDSSHIADYSDCLFIPTINKVVFAFTSLSDSAKGKAVVGTVNGTSMDFGTIAVWGDTDPSNYNSTLTFNSDTNIITLFNQSAASDSSVSIKGGEISVSGTNLTFGTRSVFRNYLGVDISTVFDNNSNRSVLFTQNTDSNKGAAIVFQNTTVANLTAENYIGISNGVYASGADATIQVKGSVDDAQSSLTPGQSYFIQADGTLGTTAGNPSVFAGTAVASTKLIVKG